jgi:hypothetical protein
MPSHPPLTTAGYDIIGDIHGQAGKLRRLLERMRYVERQGVYSHAHRQVIFVGDFIDRGPRQWETLQVARAMIEQDHALAVLGNHEFNALAWTTADPEDPTTYLRSHTPKNHRQHAAFLAEVGQDSTRYTQALDWFWSLPVYLDLPELRIIHAWSPSSNPSSSGLGRVMVSTGTCVSSKNNWGSSLLGLGVRRR